MERYAPASLDLAPRDVVARAIVQEIHEGRGFDGGYVHLDLRHLGPDRIRERLPGIRQIAMDFAGVDPVTGPVPVQPGQHYSMGGIDVDIDGATPVRGLYAAGECACISVHGANRLGGNSLLETVVFGRLVAESFIRDIPSLPPPAVTLVEAAMQEIDERIGQILDRRGALPLITVIDAMKQTMFERFGIFRDGPGMQEGLSGIKKLQAQVSQVSPANKERAANQALIRYLELEGMLLLAETVACGARAREESRGSHTRTDYPARDDSRFLAHTRVTLRDGRLEISFTPVRLGMFEPKERVY
jgi:succinate dehydrogenase / fumarate reductase flavoprotein subunit